MLVTTPWGWRAELGDVVSLEPPYRRVPGRVRLTGERPPAGVAAFTERGVGERLRASLRLRAIGGLRNPGRADPRVDAQRAGIGLTARLEHPALHVGLASGSLAPVHALRARLAQLREEGWDDAKRRVQEALLLESVASSADLKASDEEVDERLAEMAEAQGVDPKMMSEMAEAQGWRSAIESEVVDRKAMTLLEEQAQISEVEASEEA